MGDPNKAAIDKIRQAIPKYRPPSGVDSILGKQSAAGPLLVGSFPQSNGRAAGSATEPSSIFAAAAGNDDDPFAAERRMMDSLMGPSVATGSGAVGIAVGRATSTGRQPAAGPASTATSSSSAGLMADMASRLAKLEAAQKSLRGELVLREREVLSLRSQLETALADGRSANDALAVSQAALKQREAAGSEVAESASAAESAASMLEREKGQRNEIAALREDNALLRSKLHEMESFLLDYGLVWVGSSSSTSSSAPPTASSTAPSQPVPQAGSGGRHSRSNSGSTPTLLSKPSAGDANAAVNGGSKRKWFPPIDFQVLVLKLKQLNAMAGEGKARIVSKGGAHQLEVARATVPITLYADGFLLYRGPFRHWADEDSQTFLNDVLDGYFPAQFKDSHPGGLIFDIVDKSGSNSDGSAAAVSTAAASGASSSASALQKDGEAESDSSSNNDVSYVPFGGAGRSLGAVSAAVASSNSSAVTGSGGSGGPRPNSAAAARDARVHSLAGVGDSSFTMPGAPMSQADLLAALPGRVVTASGSVVDVRAGVAGAIGLAATAAASAPSAVAAVAGAGQGQNSVLVHTSVLEDMRLRAQEAALSAVGDGGDAASAPATPALPYQVATIQVRLDRSLVTGAGGSKPPSGASAAAAGGAATLIVKLKFDDTVGDLRNALLPHIGSSAVGSSTGSTGGFELRTAVPPKAYSDDNQSLRAAGLTPNATLFVRRT